MQKQLNTCLLTLLITSLGHSALAQTSIYSDDEIAKIEYDLPATPDRPAEDFELTAALEKAGFVDVTPGIDPVSSDLHVAHVFASGDLEKFIAIRYDYNPKDRKLQGQRLQMTESRVLIHGLNRDRRPIAVLAQGLTTEQLNRLMILVSSSTKSTPPKFASWSRLMIPTAHAADDIACGDMHAPIHSYRGTLRNAGGKIMRGFGLCAVAANAALADSIVGNALSLLRGRWSLSITKMFATVKQVVSDGVKTFMKVYNEGIDISVNPELIISMLCYAATSAITDLAANVITGGTSLPLFLLNSLKKFERIAEWVKRASEYRAVRNVRYLHSSLNGEPPVAYLRSGDLLTRLNRDDGKMNFTRIRAKSKEFEKPYARFKKATARGQCILAAVAPASGIIGTSGPSGSTQPRPGLSRSVR